MAARADWIQVHDRIQIKRTQTVSKSSEKPNKQRERKRLF